MNAVVASYPTNDSGQLISPFNGTLGGGFTIVIYCGGAAESSGQGLLGDELVAAGQNEFYGSVVSAMFP